VRCIVANLVDNSGNELAQVSGTLFSTLPVNFFCM